MTPKFILIPFFIFMATFANAQTYRNELGIQTDNDSYLLGGSDRYYTDGLFFYFRHALPVKANESTALQNKILGFELGQKIFNPQSGKIPGTEFIDRPFAGYTYIGSTLNFLYKNESTLKLGAQLGLIGPASGAQQVQTFVHNTFGFYHVEGWQYQVKNALELNLSAEYNKLLVRTAAFDLSLASYIDLGTGFTGAGVGPLFRLGNFNQLFYSEITQSTIIANHQITPLHRHEFFFYYKPQLNYVAYDATIQGGLFASHNDPNSLDVTMEPRPIVFSNELGLTYTANRWVFDADAIFHTRDTKLMLHPDEWGSITALYRFN